MYTIKNITYSDAGKILRVFNVDKLKSICYFCDASETAIVEESIDVSSLQRKDSSILLVNTTEGHQIVMGNNPKRTYADWKTTIIKWRYSNDDQIAIMLNKDESEEDLERYNKMQEWREWASTLSKKIIEVNTV